MATNGNLIGAQNQAVGGGACTIRLLESLAAQDIGAINSYLLYAIWKGVFHPTVRVGVRLSRYPAAVWISGVSARGSLEATRMDRA
jgi:hypothetical protein